jgi:hypothetical protein
MSEMTRKERRAHWAVALAAFGLRGTLSFAWHAIALGHDTHGVPGKAIYDSTCGKCWMRV